MANCITISRILSLLLLAGSSLLAQVPAGWSLDTCRQLAAQHYPLLRQRELIGQSGQLRLDNAAKGLLPRLQLGGQATYQSEVTRVPLEAPGFSIPVLDRDQYRLYAELTQPLTEFWTRKDQEAVISAGTLAETMQLEVELHDLGMRIDQLYFGALLQDAQIRQAEILKKDIQLGIDRIEAGIRNGTALGRDKYLLQAALLQASQRTASLRAVRKAFLANLATFTGQTLPDEVQLLIPALPQEQPGISRPELALFQAQAALLGNQEKMTDAANLPRLNLFLQGGYGRPGLNMLDNDFAFFYLGGLRLAWNLAGLYTACNDKGLLRLQQEGVQVRRETFLFNLEQQMTQIDGEISALEEMLRLDQEIIALRERVKQTAGVQLELGTMTALDYLTLVHAEDLARQDLDLHQLKLNLALHNRASVAGQRP